MQTSSESLEPGLYLVATPIGHMGDISARARQLLEQAECLCAEDTRRLRQLLNALGLPVDGRRLTAVHAHNEQEQAEGLIEAGLSGQRVVLVSDAGTPGVADPGARLVQRAWARGLRVIPVPGPSALTAAVSVSGFLISEDHPLSFWGFLPAKAAGRRATLERMRQAGGVVVTFEAPHRIEAALQDAASVLGETTPTLLAREMTKAFETLHRGTLTDVMAQRSARLASDPHSNQGEMVLVFDLPSAAQTQGARTASAQEWARLLSAELPASAAAKLLVKGLGLERAEAYQMVTSLAKRGPADAPSQ
ncbi:MAG TPA: 16S rRNA (cytidine(1402)-2'-O)-methyltransferase [Burkholderiaceae bacterium]|jgi:16S rRNA (cytidine1402-2'-O)-methyltransferase|nr:16S rRNA (cytidine(1402)-2'-O)-methyltransferase [Burkholderiaceae bacterium]